MAWLLSACVVLALISAISGKGVVLIIGGSAGLQLGCYNDSTVQTPNIDSIAQKGVLFTNAFTNNVAGGGCSRSTLFTGIPSHQNGQYGVQGPPANIKANEEVQSISNILGKAGVKTGFIGVKNIGPEEVFKFDMEASELTNNELDVGRNITFIKELVVSFLDQYGSSDFFLVISPGDPERCKDKRGDGAFCENYGDPSTGSGSIPDWHPVTYDPANLTIPYFVPDTPVTRQEWANMNRVYNRMDQGVGLYLQALQDKGVNAMVIYTSNGGVEFPGSRFNAWDAGSQVPLIMSHKNYAQGQTSDAIVSSLDVPMTILDFFGVPFPDYSIDKVPVKPTGASLVPILQNPATGSVREELYLTQEYNGLLQDFFPIRGVKNGTFTLIRNSQTFFKTYPKVFVSDTMLHIINMTRSGLPSGWWRTYDEYIKRPEFELYDGTYDPQQVDNVAHEPKYAGVLQELRQKLFAWQSLTSDPWLCDQGYMLIDGECVLYWM